MTLIDSLQRRLTREPRLRMSHLAGLGDAAPDRLRLLLAVGRSGTTWISRVLASGSEPCRYLSEPLYKLQPAMRMSKFPDRVAMPHDPDPRRLNLLLAAYRGMTTPAGHRDLQVRHGIVRDDDAWSYCLVKEVHALLATEPLLEALKPPAVGIVRDPLYVADSILDLHGLNNTYLAAERAWMSRGGFGDRYLPGGEAAWKSAMGAAKRCEPRARVIAELAATIAAINHMLIRLAESQPNLRVFRYEAVCRDPARAFPELAEALDVAWTEGHRGFLDQNLAKPADGQPYSIQRDTSAQAERSLRLVTPAEADTVRDLLQKAGLATPERCRLAA